MPYPFGKRSGDTRDTGNAGARKRDEQTLVQQLIGVRQHALNLPKSVLPKVFLVKRRNNLRLLILAVLPAVAGP